MTGNDALEYLERQARAAGLSDREWMERSGLSANVLSYHRGKARPGFGLRLETFVALCSGLDLHPGAVLDEIQRKEKG